MVMPMYRLVGGERKMLTYILVLDIAEDNVSISLFLISGAKFFFFALYFCFPVP